MNRRTVLDTDVAAALAEGQTRQDDRLLAPVDRRKVKRDRSRVKMTIDVLRELRAALKDIAQSEKCSISGIASAFLAAGVREWKRGTLDLSDVKRESRSPLHHHIVPGDVVQEIIDGKREVFVNES